MSNKQQYRQCKMEKPTARGKLVHVAWIPTRYAHVGKSVQLKLTTLGGEEVWDGPWQVVEASSGTRDYEEMDRQRDAQKRWESVLK